MLKVRTLFLATSALMIAAPAYAQQAPSFTGPNGLYGMVSDHIGGPWKPLNDSGLVFANPSTAPIQAYSWLVLNNLTELSFIDRPRLQDEPTDPAVARRHFWGTPAPSLRLKVHVDQTALL